MTKKKKKRNNFEFSKIILAFIIISYFIGLIFGMMVIWKMINNGDSIYISTSLCGLFSYIAAPVAIAIGFYCNKAKAENIEKIKGNTVQNDVKIPLN